MSVPTPEHAAGMGQEAFSGKTAARRTTEGVHERKTLSTFATAGTQAGQLPLPHDPGAEEAGQQPDPPGVLQLWWWKLLCAGRWRHLHLSADDYILRLLQVVSLVQSFYVY